MATKSVAKRSAKKVLKYNKKELSEFRRLPFVGKGCWDVPATGGYSGGCEMGKWAAFAFMRYMRDRKEPHLGSSLQHIVLDMVREDVSDSTQRGTSRHGQIVGFFTALDKFLSAIAKADPELDAYTEEDLADAMTRAVNFDDAAWSAAMRTIEDLTGKGIYIPFQAYQKTKAKAPKRAAS